MRRFVILAALLSSPALAAAPPLCALPAPTAIRAAEQHPLAPLAAPPPVAGAAPHPAPALPLPAALAAIPFVQHVASAGAVVFDLGLSHGLRSIAARSGDQFMIFQITEDKQAAVSGAMTELTPAQLTAVARGNITELGTQHGLRGLFVRSGAQFQVFYATPDGQRVIPGMMWDAAGKDITRQQVAQVPGAIPTVVVGGADPATSTEAPVAAALPLVRKASFGTVGSASAPHLWMLIDPQCIYSMQTYEMLQPYVASGKLRLSVIPLSVLDYEDHDQSTRSALALLSKPSDQIVSAWQAGSVSGADSPDAVARLRTNMAIAHAIQVKGTPTLIWRKPDGSEGRIDGVPNSVAALVSSIGS